MKNGLGLGLDIKVLVLKKKSWCWSWSWRKSLDIFKTLMNDKNYKPHYKKHKFVPAFVLLWPSSNPSCSAAINEWHKGEMWQMVANWIKITKLHNEWNGIDICLTNNHLPNFCDIFLLIPLLAITECDMIWKWNKIFKNVELHIQN